MTSVVAPDTTFAVFTKSDRRDQNATNYTRYWRLWPTTCGRMGRQGCTKHCDERKIHIKFYIIYSAGVLLGAASPPGRTSRAFGTCVMFTVLYCDTRVTMFTNSLSTLLLTLEVSSSGPAKIQSGATRYLQHADSYWTTASTCTEAAGTDRALAAGLQEHITAHKLV